MTPHRTPAPAPFSPGESPRTRYAPDKKALSADIHISDADVLAVIEARGGATYSASVDTGLANRFPYVTPADRKRAVQHALDAGVIVRTPMGIYRRPPREDD